MNMETLISCDAKQAQDNGKRKSVTIDKQLKALEEGRKKQWLQDRKRLKEAQPTSTSEEEDESTETHT